MDDRTIDGSEEADDVSARTTQLGTDYHFTSGFMEYKYSASDFGTVPPFCNFFAACKIFFKKDIAICEDYDSSALPRLKFLVIGCQFMRVSESVRSVAYEYKMLLLWTQFDGSIFYVYFQ